MSLKPHADRHISLHVSVYNPHETNASDWWLVSDFDKTNNTLYKAITSPFPLDELHKSHQQFAENPLPGLGYLCSRSPPITCFACLQIVPTPNQDTLVPSAIMQAKLTKSSNLGMCLGTHILSNPPR
jgi:hypothetical protein